MADYLQQPPERQFNDLRLLFCGRQDCEPLYSFGPVVRPNYIIHYVTKGKGIFRVGQETRELHEKEGFLIEPEVQTFYQADQEDPWSYLWVGFDGTLAPSLLRELGLGENRLTYFCDRKEELQKVISDMLQNQIYSGANDLYLQSQLYLFFSILLKSTTISAGSSLSGKNDYVRGAIRFIRNNYTDPISVADIASYTGIDRTYLYTLFKRETGMSPSEYLRNFRLTRAAELLRLTRYSVESIALSCGYQDALAFSKAFKQNYGITPVRYRQHRE